MAISEMNYIGGGGGTPTVNAFFHSDTVYTTAHSETIPESDYILAGANAGVKFYSTPIKRGDTNIKFEIGNANSTVCYISLSADGKTVSWTQNNASAYLCLTAISIS